MEYRYRETYLVDRLTSCQRCPEGKEGRIMFTFSNTRSCVLLFHYLPKISMAANRGACSSVQFSSIKIEDRHPIRKIKFARNSQLVRNPCSNIHSSPCSPQGNSPRTPTWAATHLAYLQTFLLGQNPAWPYYNRQYQSEEK
jgi:hypothetical protein